jgi:hypothetical protein
MNNRHFSPAHQKLRTFFLWLTRRAFQDLQVRDAEAADYISDMLARFARTDRLYRVRDVHGRRLESVVEMLLEMEKTSSAMELERNFFRYLGDYLLFMSGHFREYVEAHGFLNYYLQEGPRAYRRVWEMERGLFSPKARLFERLWSTFEFYAGALHYMRKTFFHDPHGGEPFTDWQRRVVELAG